MCSTGWVLSVSRVLEGNTFLITSYSHSNPERWSQFLFYRWGNKSLNHLAKLRQLLSYVLLNCQATSKFCHIELDTGDTVWGEVPFFLWDPRKRFLNSDGRQGISSLGPIFRPILCPVLDSILLTTRSSSLKDALCLFLICVFKLFFLITLSSLAEAGASSWGNFLKGNSVDSE